MQSSATIKEKTIFSFMNDDVLSKDRRNTFSRRLGHKVHHKKVSSKNEEKCEQHLDEQREREREGHLQEQE